MRCVHCGDEVSLYVFQRYGSSRLEYCLRTKQNGSICEEAPGPGVFGYHGVMLGSSADVEAFLQDVPTIVEGVA